MTELLLDERIMWSVFLPIVYVTFILTMTRTYFSKYNQYKQQRKPVARGEGAFQQFKDKNLMSKCDILTKKNSVLSQEAFNSRRNFLCTPETGYLTQERQPKEQPNPMAQMQDMMQSMGSTMPTIIITIVTIGWINYTFGGVLLAKVPFMLTQQFKSITQSGIEMENLNVQYISGMSFYFVIMFGLGQIYSLFLKDEEQILEALETNMNKKPNPMAQQQKMGANPMMPGMGMPGMGAPGMTQQDPNQKRKEMFKNVVENLSIVDHHFIYDKCPEAAEKRLRQQLNA